MNPKIVIIIQARMGSTRLPGKILVDLCGHPMLAQQIYRLKYAKVAKHIVIATTTSQNDDPIVDLAKKLGVNYYRGSENDVLSRFTEAAKKYQAEIVVRITADCPLIDAGIVDTVTSELINHSDDCDYSSNVIKRTFPRGLDVEAFFFDVLLRLDRIAKSQQAREHVTSYLRSEHPELFRCYSVEDYYDNSDLRWTVDTPTDLDLIRSIYEQMDLVKKYRPYQEILAFIRSHPEFATINQGIETWDPISSTH